jgi:uncharacterized membrane protein
VGIGLRVTAVSARPRDNDASAGLRVLVACVIGVCVGVGVLALSAGEVAPLAGWDGAGIVYLVWIWSSIWRLDPGLTARRSVREDPGRVVADVVLLSASITSLAAVGLILVDAGNSHGTTKNLLVGIGIISVVVAWGIVHTVFTLRYARFYYSAQPGGIDFNENDPPRYSDFAYLAFTVGMTFQVSDTDLKTKEIRATALRHALLSYVFGVVIIATTINLIAGLTK